MQEAVKGQDRAGQRAVMMPLQVRDQSKQCRLADALLHLTPLMPRLWCQGHAAG